MLIVDELNKLNSIIISSLSDNSSLISDELINFITAKSKKLRPSVLFLFAKALNIPISEKIYSLACAVELIHNSTLIHDDIIDNAQTRRGKVSLNIKLGNNLSVLAGDTLLAVALKQLAACNNIDVINTFADCLYNMCKGEINQDFNLNNLPDLEEYIKKSEYKTAELFKAPLISLAYLYNIPQKSEITEFARNFGITFQIKDDLLNILNTDTSKPSLNDIYNGVYTAPVLFLNEDVKIENLTKEKITELVQNKKYIQKTIDLIKKYAEKTIEVINFMPDNIYKKEIINITENLYKAGING